jgi:hypothetical protein
MMYLEFMMWSAVSLWGPSRWLVLGAGFRFTLCLRMTQLLGASVQGTGCLQEFPVSVKAEGSPEDTHLHLTLVILPSAAFIRVVGSEFVQKYLGEAPRMVRDVFRLAKENAPAIIFIDEIDAIATKRFDAQTGGE